jgi:hypothetical protein
MVVVIMVVVVVANVPQTKAQLGSDPGKGSSFIDPFMLGWSLLGGWVRP